MSHAPWLSDGREVADDLGVEPGAGLPSAEAAGRLRRVGPNRLDPAARMTAWKKVLAQFADPLVYLLLVAVAISVVTWGFDGVPAGA